MADPTDRVPIKGPAVDQCDVVIVNFNAGGFLQEAAESALRSPSVASLCIVDNASSDGSLDVCAGNRDPRLTIIRNECNLGFAAGCNIGLARCRAENVLLLNPDCRVAEGAIEGLIAGLRSGDRVGMAGPLLLNPDGSEQAVGRRAFPTPGVVLAQALGSLWNGRTPGGAGLPRRNDVPAEPIEVQAISGACMMVRRAAAEAVGPLDERYFLHFEDLDWCMRFRLAGWTTLFVPAAKVVHQKGVSSRHRPLAVEYYKHRGMVRFYDKFLRGAYPRWLMALIFAGVWVRFAGLSALRLFSRPRRAPLAC